MSKNKKHKNSYILSMFIPMLVGTVMLAWYASTESVIEKLLIGFIFFTALIPFTLQIITMLLNGAVTKGIRSNRRVDKNGKFITSYHNKDSINSKDSGIKKSYKAKTIDNEFYSELRNRIKELVKSKEIDRQSILQFKSELDYRLGSHQYNYGSFTFENDVHEIYVKLKSSKLTNEDYTYLKGILEDLAG